MEFTIYTFGDVEIFRAALAGVAMVFDADTGFFVSKNSGLGLGALAGLGLLIGLVFMLLQGVMKQKFETGEFLVLIIVFVVMFVPKFSVNVEDYNGSAIAKVDHVPLGVALPAGLVSGLARELNIKLGTAFSTVNGYPSGLMTPQALTSSLKLLHSLRDAAPQVRHYAPRLASNIRNLIAYCAAGRDGVRQRWEGMRVSDDPVVQLIEFARTQKGLAMYTKSGQKVEVLVPCSDAAEGVRVELDTFMTESESSPNAAINSVLTAAAVRSNAAVVRVVSGTPEVIKVTPDDQASALAIMAQAEAQTAAKFLRSALLNPDVSATLHCAGKSANPTDWSTCMPFQEATLKYNEDSAAAGSFFQRLMYHGMNVLFFLWICLSPVVATVMLMMGIRGLKLAGSYLLFGAWTVSWYVGASMVNFYVLKQVQYEVAMLGGIANLTEESIRVFAGAGGTLATKIAMAGDMMASVPLLMMAVMSGSVYGMTALAQKMSGRDYHDESRNVPAASDSTALHHRENLRNASYDSNLGLGGSIGYTAAPVLAESAALSNAAKSAEASSMSWSNKQSHALQQNLSNMFQHGIAGEVGDSLSSGLKSVGATKLASMAQLSKEIAESKELTVGEKRTLQDGLSGALGGSFGPASVQMQLALQRARTLGIGRKEGETLKSLESGSKEFSAALSNEMANTNLTGFKTTGAKIDALTNSTAWGETQEIAEARQKSFEEAQALTRAAGIERKTDLADLGRQINAKPGHAAKVGVDQAAKDLWERDGDFRTLVETKARSYSQTTMRDYSPETKMTLAKLDAMSSYAPASGAYVQALGAVHGSAAMAGVDHTQWNPDTSKVGSAGALTGGQGDPAGAANATIERAKAATESGHDTTVKNFGEQAENLPPDTKKPDVSRLNPTAEKFKNEESRPLLVAEEFPSKAVDVLRGKDSYRNPTYVRPEEAKSNGPDMAGEENKIPPFDEPNLRGLGSFASPKK